MTGARYATKHPRLPVGAGSAIVVWKRSIQGYGITGFFLAGDVLTFFSGYTGAATTAGRVADCILTGILLLCVAGVFLVVVTSRSRIEITADTISYISPRDDVLTLDRDPDGYLRSFAGSGPFVTTGYKNAKIPISGIGRAKFKRACLAKGWRFS
jgi:hypothetical protein